MFQTLSCPSNDTERLAWLRLIRSENVGPATFWSLLERFGSAIAALEALPDLAGRGGLKRPIRLFCADHAHREMEALTRAGGHFLYGGTPAYPVGLAAIADPPPVLSGIGDIDTLTKPMVAIVGARNASALGRQLAQRLGHELARADITVVSGLARGIDTAAHHGALEGAASKSTVAVMAGGVDHLYPPENDALYDKISTSGLILSEMPFGFPPQARHFPRRNRLVSGLSLGIAVIEAAAKSGSLITARFALEQGRDVFAVPGSPLDPRAKGANHLIKQGAQLIEDAGDILEALAPLLAQPTSHRFAETLAAAPQAPHSGREDDRMIEEARRKLKPLLGPVATSGDDLARAADLPASLCLSVLLQWELAGVVTREPGAGYVITAAS